MARRYLFSRKKVGAINIISGIAATGIAFASAALICLLSVFNGFHDLIGGLYTTFDAELKVSPAKGKLTLADDPALLKMQQMPEVESASQVLEDNALILFRGRPTAVMLKGVDKHYDSVTGIRTILYGTGQYQLSRAGIDYGIPGIGLCATMGGIDYGTIQICAPRKGERINLTNPVESFNALDITSPGICFDVRQQKYNENYLITSLSFAQNLFEQPGMISAVEIKLKPGTDVQKIKSRMQQTGGGRYVILDRMQQQEDMYRNMNIEKAVTYLFLTFILVIACFNIIGSVSMLIIDKKSDIQTLKGLGATNKTVFQIFLAEARFIALTGAIIGTAVGLVLCWIQETFGLISLGGSSGSFIVEAYPVSIHFWDIPLVLFTVIIVGFASVWYPVKVLCRRITQ